MSPPVCSSSPTRGLLVATLVLAVAALGRPLLAQNDGDLDSRYDIDGVARVDADLTADGDPVAVACGPDGTCYTVVTHLGDFRAFRFSRTGVFVTTGGAAFQLGGSNRDQPYAAAVQADGKLVLAGSAEDSATVGNSLQVAIARLDPAGGNLLPDSSFSGDGRQNVNFVGDAWGYAVAIAPDQKIVVAGCYQTGSAAGLDILVLRFDSTGTLDPSFDGNGIRTFGFDEGSGNNDCANAVAVQSDGKIAVAGYAQFGDTDHDFAVARLDINGALDGSFSGDGKVTVAFDLGSSNHDAASAVAIDHLGRIVAAGAAYGNTPHVALTRLTAAGALDSSFGTLAGLFSVEGVPAMAVAIAPPPSNRILYFDGNGIAALTRTGHVDTSFSGDGYVPYDDPATLDEFPTAMTFFAGMPVLTGTSATNTDPFYNFVVARYFMRQIFGDDFESGSTNGWWWHG
jgi:uncharacterized delta-60 repeat protein